MANRTVSDVGTDRTIDEVSGNDDVKYRSIKKGGAKFPWHFPIQLGADFEYREVKEV